MSSQSMSVDVVTAFLLIGDKAVFCTATKSVQNNRDTRNTGNRRCDCDFIWAHKSNRQPTQICKRLALLWIFIHSFLVL